MDTDLQKLIDDYVKEIESKEGDLLSFKKMIDNILSLSREKFKQVKENLENRFNTNEISEEEYLSLFREEKKNILEKTKLSLDSLLAELASGNLAIDEEVKKKIERENVDSARIEELRKSLHA